MKGWPAGIIAFSCATVGISRAGGGTEEIRSSMDRRHPKVDALLKDGKAGETLDGRLWKFQCGPADLLVVSEENTDRAAMARAIASEKGISSKEAANALAEERLRSLPPGVKRQVAVNGAAVWWDGIEPNPAGAIGSETASANVLVSAGKSASKRESATPEVGPPELGALTVEIKAREAEVASLRTQLHRMQGQLAAADQRARYFEQKGAESHLRLASANAHLLYTQTRRMKLSSDALGDTNPKLGPLKESLSRLASDYRSHVINLAEFDQHTVDGALKDLQLWYAQRPEAKDQALTLQPIMEDITLFRSGKSMSTDDLKKDLLKRLEDLY